MDIGAMSMEMSLARVQESENASQNQCCEEGDHPY